MVCLKKQKRLASTFGILFVAEKVRSEFWMLVVMFLSPGHRKRHRFSWPFSWVSSVKVIKTSYSYSYMYIFLFPDGKGCKGFQLLF